MQLRILLPLLFSLPISALAQTDNTYIETKDRKIDSLKKLFANASRTQRVDILNELTATYYNYQRDSSWIFSQQAIDEATSIQFYKGLSLTQAYRAILESSGKGNQEKGKLFAKQAVETAMKGGDAVQMGTALHITGNILIRNTEFPEGFQALEMAESIFKKAGEEKQLIKVYDSKGSAYLKMNRLYDAVKSMNESARLNKKIGDKTGYADALHNIGEIYYNLKEDSIAVSYYKQSLAVGAPPRAINTWNTPHKMANAYLTAKLYDSALLYYNQAIAIINKMVNDPDMRKHQVFGVQVKIGELYVGREEADKALELLLPYYEHFKTKNDVDRLVQVLPKMGTAYLNKKDYQKALMYANEMLPLCAKSKSGTGYKKAYDILADAYLNLNRPDRAYHYLKLSMTIKDSIDKENFKSNTSFYKTMLENEAAQTKIELLHKDNQLKQQNLDLLTAMLENDAAASKIALLDKDNQLKQQELNLLTATVENKTAESKINLLNKNNELLNKNNELLNKDNQLKKQRFNLLVGGLIGLLILALVFVRYLNVKRKNEAHRRALLENELQIQKLESEKKQVSLQRHASELEMQALRSQMNPHFIFNCLNAINHFILNNETETASDYLTKFSRLIRQVLQNSSKKTILLADEIDTLRLYIELEQVRFKNRFEFSITVDEDIDADGIIIPPMLLQPFVENAIWHGLMQKEDNGELTIDITRKGERLLCTITDNGVGRNNANATKNPLSQKKSMGMQITATRLKMLEQSGDFTVIDLNDKQGKSNGTKVVVTIPAVMADMVAA